MKKKVTDGIEDVLLGYVLDCGTSPFQLAQVAKVSQGTMSKFVNGKSKLNGSVIGRLMKALNLTIVQTSKPDLPPGRRRGRPKKGDGEQ